MARTRLKAPTPDGVELSRDEHGVPHIEASDLEGAHWAMGYCHALDRGMQMCFMRLLGQGRAAECLRSDDELVEIDRFFRRMNWAGVKMKEQIDGLDPEMRTLCDAYNAGVNARFAKARPFEFKLVGYRPEPWTIEDTMLISRMVGYLTLSQSQAEVERMFVELVQAGVPDDKLEALFPGCTDGLERELIGRIELDERVVPEALTWMTGTPRMMASNNWVVSGAKTRSGAAMMSNDPHLEVNRLPNVWCELALETPEQYMLTMTMPGMPAALIGRNRDLSWGATYTFMDAVDSWMERCKDGTYLNSDGTWAPFDTRVEVIERKGKPPVEVTFYENEHGTLEGDPTGPEERILLTTRWAPSESGARSLNAARAMWTAGTAEEGMRALGELETAWNWVFADRAGSIGYQMSGLMPRRAEGVDGFAPRPGWDATYDWRGYVPAEELPRELDPERGFIVTANDDLNHLGEADPINMPMGDYRAKRIAELLGARDDHDLSSFSDIQLDEHAIQAVLFMDILRPLLPDTPGGRILADWDHGYGVDQRGATLFEDFYDALCVEVFSTTFGEHVIRHLRAETGIFIDFYQDFDRVLLDPQNIWLDGRTQEEVYAAAFAKVDRADVTPWGRRNQVTLTHIFFQGNLPGFLGFDYGPLPLRGGRATPHQGQVYKSAGRDTSFAPSVRIVADMSDDVLMTSMAGGPSDRRFSKWYTSGVEGWLRGDFKTLKR